MNQDNERRSGDPPPHGAVAEVLSDKSDKPESPTIRLDIAPGAIAKGILIFLGMKLLLAVWQVFILIGFSLMLTAAFNPTVRKLQAKISRTSAVIALVAAGVGMLIGLLFLLVPPIVGQTQSLIQHAPVYVSQIESTLRSHHINVHLQQQVQAISNQLTNSFPKVLGLIYGLGQGIAGVVVVAVLSIYLLIEGPSVGNALLRLLPRQKRLGARRMVAEMGVQVGGYVRGQLIASVLAGTFSAILLAILKVPNPLAIAGLTAVMDIVPAIGVLVATLAAVLAALSVSPGVALIVLVAYLIYHQVESHFIVPAIYGNTLGLSLSVIVISILIGVELLGIVGAMIALPIAAAVPSLVTYLEEWQAHEEGPAGKFPDSELKTNGGSG